MNTCTSDRCQQGRAKCPCPEACELPIQYAEPEPMSFGFIKWVLVCFTAIAAVSFIASLSAGFNLEDHERNHHRRGIEGHAGH